MRKLLLLSNPCMLNHGISTHPENSERLRAILEAISESPHKEFLDLKADRLATVPEISEVHDPQYIEFILSLEGKEASLDEETPVTTGSVKAALTAAGIGLELVEQVVEGRLEKGFALVRPPGHHARPMVGMGFCLFNNIAIAAKKALSMGVKRILIVDWDVHHGNGTHEMFYESDQVLFIDIHQDNLFPQGSGLLTERGKGKGLGFTINVPLPPSSTDNDYLEIFDTIVRPKALQYQPELILVSAGFDAHESDPLGFMNVTTKGFSLLASRIKALADEVSQGKLVFFLEGGYDTVCLSRNVMACLNALVEEPSNSEEIQQSASPEVKKIIQEVLKLHG